MIEMLSNFKVIYKSTICIFCGTFFRERWSLDQIRHCCFLDNSTGNGPTSTHYRANVLLLYYQGHVGTYRIALTGWLLFRVLEINVKDGISRQVTWPILLNWYPLNGAKSVQLLGQILKDNLKRNRKTLYSFPHKESSLPRLQRNVCVKEVLERGSRD
jgi:hypothetical protein